MLLLLHCLFGDAARHMLYVLGAGLLIEGDLELCHPAEAVEDLGVGLLNHHPCLLASAQLQFTTDCLCVR